MTLINSKISSSLIRIEWKINSFKLILFAMMSIVLFFDNGANACLTGRYGHYHNWPQDHDWDELLWLLTGKVKVKGLGWKSVGSFGDHGGLGGGYGGLGGGGYGGGFGGGYFGGPSFSPGDVSQNSYSSSPLRTSNINLKSEKMKQALANYFKTKKPSTAGSFGGYNGGSSDSYGPPDNNVNYGPPSPGSGYPDNGPGPGPSYDSSDDGLGPGPSYGSLGDRPGPSYGQPGNGADSGPSYGQHGNGPDSGPSYGQPGNGPDSGPSYDNGPESNYDGPPRESWPGQGQGGSWGGGRPSDSGSNFQSDYDTFGYNQKRREGRVLPTNNQPGPRQRQNTILPMKRRHPLRRHNSFRRQRLLDRQHASRRRMNTRFGGYKVDHNRLRV